MSSRFKKITVGDPAIAIVLRVDGDIEPIVTADGGEQQFSTAQVVLGMLWTVNFARLEGRCRQRSLARCEAPPRPDEGYRASTQTEE